MSSLCSTLFILAMTFERFYSIIRPHKAASFNTVKRARITIVCILTMSILFNIPHLYITRENGMSCIPFGNAIETGLGQFYYWVSFIVNFALPFVLLLTMNCFIIHTIRQRSRHSLSRSVTQGQGHGEKIKISEMYIFVILLMVTFGFLILVTPSYILFVYVMFIDYTKSSRSFAGFTFFYNVSQKAYYLNYSINFYLYVISGKKFRGDLAALLKAVARCSDASSSSVVSSDSSSTRMTSIQS